MEVSTAMKFIHAADAHIDSPLRGLARYEGAPERRLRAATREAFANLVTLALEECVDFVVIAGDLFDGEWRHMNTGLWTAGQFRRLAEAGIPVCFVRGNHDALSKVRESITWPDNVTDLGVDAPRTVLGEDLGKPNLSVAIHGQGFARASITDDLAAGYPDAVPGRFNIGVLHTCYTGSASHERYAATSPAVLQRRRYQYWALGHVHTRQTLCDDPIIAFPGNTQGRHVNESGAKGCLLVTVEDAGIEQARPQIDVAFRPTDVVRWHRQAITLSGRDDLTILYEKVADTLEACRAASDGRLAAVRLEVTGACQAHRNLVDRAGQEQAIAEIYNLAGEHGDDVWVEKIQLDTRPLVDIDRLRADGGLFGELLGELSRLGEDDDELMLLAAELSPLLDKAAPELAAGGDAAFDGDCAGIHRPDQMRRWLRQAESYLVECMETQG